MGRHVNLLRSLPRTSRDTASRKIDKSPDVIYVAKQFGREYFDGDRKYGYGGYKYDGRWRSVAFDITEHYKRGGKTLDVGCAKGFLVHDLLPYTNAFGVDVSRYAVVEQANRSAVGRLHLASADDLPFPDQSFDLVLSINTLHNLPRSRLVKALREMRRVSRGSMFVQVDSYRTQVEKAAFEDWVLTAEWTGYPEEWLALFAEAEYNGDYAFTVI